ncbi:MAG: hypothetical protein KAW12_14030 [Candidatus Aminicenantes bacterium]|nr:hypothetical protein [Candidatus Aminicenantes bacterium]
MNYKERIAGFDLDRHEKAYSLPKNIHCSSLEIADDEIHFPRVDGAWRRREGILL